MTGLRVGVVGLGSMGLGIATSLHRAGIETWGFDVSDRALSAFSAAGGRVGETDGLDALVVVVVNAAQAEAALFGEGGHATRMKAGGLILACPTMDPAAAKRLAAMAEDAGLLYLDAPISGGAAKATEGKLTVMASGTPKAMKAAGPVLAAIAGTVFRLGDAPGPASAMKIVNQLLAGVHIASAAEAMTFGLSMGIAPGKTLEVISKCAGTSWMFENRGPHIVEGDYAPRSAVDIFVKDLGIVTEIAGRARFAAPMAATALQQFLAAAGQGLGREDDAAVAKVYARNAGLTLPGKA